MLIDRWVRRVPRARDGVHGTHAHLHLVLFLPHLNLSRAVCWTGPCASTCGCDGLLRHAAHLEHLRTYALLARYRAGPVFPSPVHRRAAHCTLARPGQHLQDHMED